MRTLALLAMALAVAGGSAMAQERSAEWVRRPTAGDIMSVFPNRALKEGVGGRVVLACIVTVQGTLRACKAESETPAGQGFGGAATALASQFLLRPAMKAGAAVESVVRIPVDFAKPDRDTGSFITPTTRAPHFIGDRVYNRLPYREAPTYGDVLAAYPAKARAARVGGAVSLNCRIGDGGRLGSCAVIDEQPRGYGFAGAVHDLAPKFVVPATEPSGTSIVGARVLVRISFAAASLENDGHVVRQPPWSALPRASDLAALIPQKAREARVLQARVVIGCRVVAGGGLDGCAVEQEDPPSYGYDQAALALARYFRLPIWTEEGLPTVGGAVRVPVRFDFSKPAPAATAPSAPAAPGASR
jgi:hypothetical protein